MSRTACYVCNFNGKEYVKNCVASVLSQVEIDDSFHLYVVDNASTDGSVECIRDTFGDRVRMIQNSVNLGGAGGFNTALRDAMDKDYDYVILLDNDIIVEKGCISAFVNYLGANSDVGCVGAKIMIMDRPDYIQEFGGQLDFESYDLIKDYWYELDQGTEDVIESDWVSSCALIARVDAVRKTSLFPEENFLFWDDIEFTYQIKLSGYKVMSLASAKVYHKGKKKSVDNTGTSYYSMRNRIKFFAKYEAEERLPQLCRNMLDRYFQMFFGSASKGFHAANSSRMFALDDFVHKHYGKIDENKLYPMDEMEDKLQSIIKNHQMACIELPDAEDSTLMEAVGVLCRRLDETDSIKKAAGIVKSGVKREELRESLKRYYDHELEFIDEEKSAALVFRPCSHFKEVTEDVSPKIWFDKYLNCIVDHEDFARIQAFPYIREFFINICYEWLMRGIVDERNRSR